ncbi:tyrosine-type recombinase/integrase [Paludisphaera rhizosphaerae]|uniref:tyrosine-type recombinase/integrase n=1 Tax=Paludisphaera rhizosphaerae TaxID=2711216 RepID=UPI0013EC985A|nr:site-specific integrase [Paludisphaera rhizosphaerae]
MSAKPPSYRLHRASGQAIVTIDRRDHYLGKHGTPESKRAYDRLVSEWLANGRRLPDGDVLPIFSLMRRYLEHISGRYESNEPELIKSALRPLFDLYGDTPAAEFGPLALEVVRERIRANGHVRSQVNRRVRAIVRMFRWGVSRQLVPSSTWEALRSLEGLRRGEPGTREGDPVRPVADVDVDAVLPHVSRQVRAMIDLQRLTGARPGEVCIMRTCDVDATGAVWTYTPEHHKTEHHGKRRTIYIGPKAQAVLRPWLRSNGYAYLFSPRHAELERLAMMAEARGGRVQPSQVDRSSAGRMVALGGYYMTEVYRLAIRRAVDTENALRREKDGDKAKLVGMWSPNQLRHSAATKIRRELGIDVAQVILGHSSPAITEIYAEVDEAKAVAAMQRMG